MCSPFCPLLLDFFFEWLPLLVMLMTLWLVTVWRCLWTKHYFGGFYIKKRSPTSQTCHQYNLSPTSAINIDLAFNLLCTTCSNLEVTSRMSAIYSAVCIFQNFHFLMLVWPSTPFLVYILNLYWTGNAFPGSKMGILTHVTALIDFDRSWSTWMHILCIDVICITSIVQYSYMVLCIMPVNHEIIQPRVRHTAVFFIPIRHSRIFLIS